MGYLFLFIALLANTGKGYCGKMTSGYTRRFSDAIWANCIRMILCAAIGAVTVLAGGDLPSAIPDGKLLLLCALSGICTAVLVVTWLLTVQRSAFMVVDIFLALGLLIPLSVSALLFQESIRPTQWAGIALLLCAVVIMCSYNNSIKVKMSPSTLLLLLICGISNGMADLSQKLFTQLFPEGSASVFNFYTYCFAAAVLVITYLAIGKPDHSPDSGNFRRIFGYLFVMALCLFANSYFKTLAAGHLSAVLLYPLNQGGALMLSTAMAAIVFREKLTPRAVVGILTAFAGLLVIHLIP